MSHQTPKPTVSLMSTLTDTISFCMYTADGMEVGTGEIKPYQATDALVEEDRCRIAESCKKQLHQRLSVARSKKELQTYGIMINGTQVQLSTLQLSETDEHNYFIMYLR